MKTSVIRYRVADFLKLHPPFDVLPEEDLLHLAGTGRVAFHERDEYVFRRGQPHAPAIRVVQQGRIELFDGDAEAAPLRDVVGEGDILGLERFLDAPGYLFSARTASDVILYSIDAAAFEALLDKHPAVRSYLAAYFSLNGRFGALLGLDAAPLPDAAAHRPFVTCDAAAPLHEVARLVSRSAADAVAVVDPGGRALGLITTRDLAVQVATGSIAIDAPAAAIMDRRLTTAPPGLGTAAYQLAMIRGHGRFLGIGGEGPLEGLLRDLDLALHCGRDPVLLARELRESDSAARLAYVLRRADAFLSGALVGPSAIDLCAAFGREFLRAALECVLSRAEAGSSCGWFFSGRAGRGETPALLRPDFGLVYPDPPPGSEQDAAERFGAAARTVATWLDACGLPHAASAPEAGIPLCLPLSGWKRYFSQLVQNPILNWVYAARGQFDLHAIAGEANLAHELAAHISAEIETNDSFVRILAHDTLSHLPPLTFFQGVVIQLDGAASDTLDIETTALLPIVDAARVFALAGRHTLLTGTIARLERAAAELPQSAAVFHEAADAFRVLSYHRARLAADTLLDPARLGKFDQRLLKTAFSAIHNLLDLTTAMFGLGAHP